MSQERRIRCFVYVVLESESHAKHRCLRAALFPEANLQFISTTSIWHDQWMMSGLKGLPFGIQSMSSHRTKSYSTLCCSSCSVCRSRNNLKAFSLAKGFPQVKVNELFWLSAHPHQGLEDQLTTWQVSGRYFVSRAWMFLLQVLQNHPKSTRVMELAADLFMDLTESPSNWALLTFRLSNMLMW